MTAGPSQVDSPWPHRLAWLLVATTFPLIWVGGLVTTYEAGMAVPDWPSTYGYNLFLYPWQTWLFGPWDLFIEHGHRLLGAAAGLVSIALVVVTRRCDSRGWVRSLAWIALAAVCLQGLLGGLRVLLDQRLLALVHGCTGPTFFALAGCLVVVTGREWASQQPPLTAPVGAAWRRWAAGAAVASYVQLLLGAHLRHLPAGVDAAAFRVLVLFHLAVAGILLLHAVALARLSLQADAVAGRLRWGGLALGGLLVVQLALGSATWVVNYGWPSWFSQQSWAAGYVVVQEGPVQALVTTAHVAVGSLILASSVALTVGAFRWCRPAAWIVAPGLLGWAAVEVAG